MSSLLDYLISHSHTTSGNSHEKMLMNWLSILLMLKKQVQFDQIQGFLFSYCCLHVLLEDICYIAQSWEVITVKYGCCQSKYMHVFLSKCSVRMLAVPQWGCYCYRDTYVIFSLDLKAFFLNSIQVCQYKYVFQCDKDPMIFITSGRYCFLILK